MIRDATEDDVPTLVELGRLMHAESPVFSRLTFDPERFSVTVRNTIQSPAGFAKVVETEGQVVGGMLAFVIPHFCSSDLVACDVGLFMHPDFRGGTGAARLLTLYRAWADEHGAKIIQLGIMTGVQVQRTQAMCERMGWALSGVVMEVPCPA